MMMVLFTSAISLLSGCVTEQQRVDRCVATGVSRDTCYHEEKEYWRSVNANYATERAAETQADAFREGMGNNKHKKKRQGSQESYWVMKTMINYNASGSRQVG